LRLGELRSSILGILEVHYYEKNILRDARTLSMEDYYDNLTETTDALVNIKQTYFYK